MKSIQSSRREFFSQCSRALAFVLSTGLILTGCKPKEEKGQTQSNGQDILPCENMEHVSETDITLRTKLGYVKESPIPDNQCQNCNLFLPPKGEDKCGGCMLFKGPVYPEAYCTYWAPRA